MIIFQGNVQSRNSLIEKLLTPTLPRVLDSLPMGTSWSVLVRIAESSYMMARLESPLTKLGKESTKEVSLVYLGQKTRSVFSQQALIRLSSSGMSRQARLSRLGDLEAKELSVSRIIKSVLFGLLEEAMEWLSA
jgi:hypothetical protein